MNNAKRGREGADRVKANAGFQILLAAGDSEITRHPMTGLAVKRSPRAKGKMRDYAALSDTELDEILAGPEPTSGWAGCGECGSKSQHRAGCVRSGR